MGRFVFQEQTEERRPAGRFPRTVERDSLDVWCLSRRAGGFAPLEEVSMLDPRTLWLTLPEDRYQATPAMRWAERALFPLLRTGAPPRPSDSHSGFGVATLM